MSALGHPETWDELCGADPSLKAVDRIFWLLEPSALGDETEQERRKQLVYLTLKAVVEGRVGWYRALDSDEWDGRPWGVLRVVDLRTVPIIHRPEPSNETERFLRTNVAYDIAMRHVMDMIEDPALCVP